VFFVYFIATLNAALFVGVKVIFIVTFYNYHIKCNKKWYPGLTGEASIKPFSEVVLSQTRLE
jgi:hypothetical protein